MVPEGQPQPGSHGARSEACTSQTAPDMVIVTKAPPLVRPEGALDTLPGQALR